MPRLAWFTPLPPTPSGIAGYNAQLLPLVAGHHQVDAFVEPASSTRMEPAAGLTVRPAHEFVWRHRQRPYDLVVYQLGNAACHDFIWPHLPRYPGLVVLHDAQLHHARARRLLADGRLDDYRAEFRYNHPEAPPLAPELFIAALAGSLYYLYPMLRWVLKSARLVAVLNPGLAQHLRESHPGVEVHTIRHGMADPWGTAECKMQNAECTMQNAACGGQEAPPNGGTPPEALLTASRQLRARLGIPEVAVLFGAFGLVTPEKRIGAALRALKSVAAAHPNAHLLLAGGTAAHYDAAAEARALGVEDRVHFTGYVPDGELPAWVQAADVCLCLRWPSGGESSATWLGAIAAGKPTVVTDLAHAGQAPALEPRTWSRLPPSLAQPSMPADPVSVSIDILDEDGLLSLAMHRLAADAALRESLGRAARRYWELQHTMGCAVEDYLRVLDRALARPLERSADLPAHLLPDPLASARALASKMGVKRELLHLTPITPGDRLDCL